jgi:hypothetical protein
MPKRTHEQRILYDLQSRYYLLAATDRLWRVRDMDFATQILPFLQLVLIGIAAIKRSEAKGLACRPAFSLQLLSPSTSRCKAIEVAPEAASGVVRKVGECGEPVAYWSG